MGKIGYIKIYRQIQESWIWSDGRYDKAHAWMDMLLLANHADKKIAINGKPKIIKRGQFHTGEEKLAMRWKWNRKTVHKFFQILQTDEMITFDGTYEGTTVTIVNYGLYQGLMDNGMDNGMDTNKNDKECIKNEKENIYSGEPERAYGLRNNVYLTKGEFEELRRKYPDRYADMIDDMSLYKSSSGRTYANDFDALIQWERRKKKDEPEPELDFLSTDRHKWDQKQWSKAIEAGKATEDDYKRIRKEVLNGTV